MIRVVEFMSNVEKCMQYMGKEELLGVKTFDFKLDEERDRVYLVKYIPNNEQYRTIEIPSFVTNITRYSKRLGGSKIMSKTPCEMR